MSLAARGGVDSREAGRNVHKGGRPKIGHANGRELRYLINLNRVNGNDVGMPEASQRVGLSRSAMGNFHDDFAAAHGVFHGQKYAGIGSLPQLALQCEAEKLFAYLGPMDRF